MQPQLTAFKEDDAFRVQVAAVVAQQAAITEDEIRLDQRQAESQEEQVRLLAQIEDLIDLLEFAESEVAQRNADLQLREMDARQLGGICVDLLRGLVSTDKPLRQLRTVLQRMTNQLPATTLRARAA
jgi:hypothetical protein